LAEVKEALEAGVDMILLDNMDTKTMRESVEVARQQNPDVLLEASGNVTLDRIVEIAQTGVDVVSVGELTHSVKALDISMYVKVDQVQ